jgi:hypothetical protein
MERKEAVYRGLEFIPVLFEDTSLTSPEYFQISEFPTRLTAGKNLFKLRGHPTNLKTGGALGFEVLDYNGNPIYSEVVDYIDEDKSRVIAIYIYENTSPGDCTVTLVADAATIENNPTPSDWQNKVNVRWTRTVPVNPMVPNVSEIIFETLPIVTVTEQIGVQLDRQYATTQFPTYSTGQVRFFSLNNQPAIELTGGKFESDMQNGTITVSSPVNPTPTPSYPISTTVYTSTIKKILTPTTALLDRPYTVYSSQSIFPHTYNSFTDSAYSVLYEATPTYSETENSQSFAYIQIEGLEPATGDISRTKIYTNNKGTIGTWDLVNDIELEETEIFVPSTSSLLPDVSIGTFVTQSTIDTYWEGHSYQGNIESTAPTLTWTTASLDRAVLIDSATNITANNSVLTFQTKNAYNGVFIATSSYKVTFDALGTRSSVSNNNNPVISVYMSGSAFDFDTTDLFNQELPVTLGKRIGELKVTSDSQRFDDVVFNFETDNTGAGALIFVVESGQWQISDVRTTTDNDVGYTPNYTRIKTFVETTHKIDNQISFKVEYYNIDGVASNHVTYVYAKDWEGGNRYVDGDYSMLTGSLYVADSLNSGIAITGNANTGFIRSLGYQGFDSGDPGFLLWSGSALSGQTSKGSPYSGVGLELYANDDNYFRYSTSTSELDIHTKTFFLGDLATQFISGANGNLEISSSGFHLQANGDVTASSFIAKNGDTVLFDSNSEYLDGVNIGRVIYFDRDEFTHTGDIGSSGGTPVTASVFETFILPGETNIQLSAMVFYDHNGTGTKNLQFASYIQSASYTSSLSDGSGTNYDSWSSPDFLKTSNALTGIASGTEASSGITLEIVQGSGLSDYQGHYVRIYILAQVGGAGFSTSTVKAKNFVYRSSRLVGGSTSAPTAPVAPAPA